MIRRSRYLNRLHEYQDNGFIKVISGVRRCGKSTILQLYRQDLLDGGIPESRMFYMNLESFENISVRDAEDLSASVQNHLGHIRREERYYVLLDEIQNVENWEKTVNGLYALGNVDLVVTGSNAFLLSSELATYLSGRYVVI